MVGPADVVQPAGAADAPQRTHRYSSTGSPLGAELALADPDRAHGGLARDDADRQLLAAEPLTQAPGIAADLHPREAAGAALCSRPRPGAVGADEEGQGRLAQRLHDAGDVRLERVALDGQQRRAVALGDGADVV